MKLNSHAATIGKRKIRPKDIAVLVEVIQMPEKFDSALERGLGGDFTDVSLFNQLRQRNSLVFGGIVNARNERAIKRALATGLLGMTGMDFQLGTIVAYRMNGGILGTVRIPEEKEFVALHELLRKTNVIPQNCAGQMGREGPNFCIWLKCFIGQQSIIRSHLRPYLFGLEQKWSKRISLKMSINWLDLNLNPFNSYNS